MKNSGQKNIEVEPIQENTVQLNTNRLNKKELNTDISSTYPIKSYQKKPEPAKEKSDMFTASVRKYTRARKLTPRMLNELIGKIEVHQSEKIDGKTVQQLTIHYNCIGNIEIPDLEKLPENKVSVHTRQGVDVHYAACAS